ncbi:TetR/AcrR family transcriptional regulator [Brevundimonas sp.]|uniref:TetR/AcrR family transcriptional regulator n=1 Tax=Brevundimonas sp. TaxID=1871086 RepID=UPI00391ACB73
MVPVPRRTAEQTRQLILDTAIVVAAEGGSLALTLDAVVERLPVSKGALLHHFPTKAALLEGMIDELARQHVEEVRAEAATDPEPYNRNARAAMRVSVANPGDEQDLVLGRAALVACAIDPALAQRWRAGLNVLAEDDPVDPAGRDDALMLRLLANGLWMSDLFGLFDVTPDQRRAIGALLTGPATK